MRSGEDLLRRTAMKSQYIYLLLAVAFATVSVGVAAQMIGAAQLRTSTSILIAANVPSASRNLYAVNQSSANRGSISVYDINRGHALVKTIQVVADVGDVKGVAVSAATGKLYVTYRTRLGAGMIYCLNVYTEAVLWDRK